MNVCLDPLFWYDPMHPTPGYWQRLHRHADLERSLEYLLASVKLLNIKEEIEQLAA